MNRRTTFLIFNISIVVLSLLTGFRILPGPDTAGIALAFYALFILPGILFSELFGWDAKADFEGITRVFLAGLTSTCFAVCLGSIPGITYSFVAMAYGATIVLALVYRFIAGNAENTPAGKDLVGSFSRKEEYSSREKKAILILFILLFTICASIFSESGELGANTDAPDHVSFIRRSLDGGGILPNDSFYLEGDGVSFDPRKGLWHPVAALWAWQGDVTPQILWKMMPAFLSFSAVVIFWFFAGELSGSIPVKAMSVIFLFLFFRGDGFAWMTKLTYSRNISQIVFWGTAAFVLRYLRNGRSQDLGAAAVTTATGTAIHLVFVPVTGMFLAGLSVYVSINRWGGKWRGRFWKAVPLIVAAAALPLAIRLLHLPESPNEIHTHLQGMMEVGGGLRLIDPAELISVMGFPFLFSVLIIPVFPIIASCYGKSRLVWILFALPSVLVLNPLTATFLERATGYMHIRLLFAAPTMVYLAMAVFGSARGALSGNWRLGKNSRGWKGNLTVRTGGFLIFVFFAVVFLKPAAADLPDNLFSAMQREYEVGDSWEGELEELFSGIPERSVVAADPVSSYYISALTNHYVTVILDQHCSPADTAAIERVKGARNLFSSSAGDSVVLAELIRSEAAYLFIDTGRQLTQDFFGVNSQESSIMTVKRFRSYEFLREIGSSGTMKLFAVEANATVDEEGYSWISGTPDLFDEGRYEILCGGGPGIDAGAGIILEDLAIGPTSIAAGDSVEISFCWSSPDRIEFGLPFYWTLRFDTDFKKGSFYRNWYGKHYRRFIERKRGEIYRYTVSGMIIGEGRQPDMWFPGERIMQEIKLRIPDGMAEGEYSVRLTVRRRAYLPNRSLKDYFLNEDSYNGQEVMEVRFVKHSNNGLQGKLQ